MSNDANAAKSAIQTVAGALIWWEFDSVLVKPADMQAILAKHGMDTQISVPSIDVVSAIRKAASSFTSGDRKNRIRAKVAGVYEDGSVEVCLVKDYVNKGAAKGDAKAGADQIDSVVFDTNAGSWLYGGTTEYAQRFMALADQKREFLGHDFVRRSIVHGPLSAMGAFPLRRKQGGFYFVPAGTVEQARVLEAIVHDIPADCELYLAEVNASTASKKSIGHAAREWLEGGIGELKTRLAAWKQVNRTPRSDAVNNALQEFTVLSDHAKLYRDALGLELADLTSQMQDAVEIAQGIAGVVSKGIPPMFVTTVKALASTHKGEVTWAQIAKTNLPDNASNDKAQGWWTSNRGSTAADLAGLTSTATKTGVTFAPIGLTITPADPAPDAPVEAPAEEPAPKAPVTEVEEIDDDETSTRKAVAEMKGPALRKALGALGQKVPAKAKVEAIRSQYLAAIGLGE